MDENNNYNLFKNIPIIFCCNCGIYALRKLNDNLRYCDNCKVRLEVIAPIIMN